MRSPLALMAIAAVTATLAFPARPAQAAAIPSVPGAPAITGRPVLDGPPILAWPKNRPAAKADLTDRSADTLVDLHGDLQNCQGVDLVFSTEGNYHMALKTLWYDHLLKDHPRDIVNWYYTTSPPVVLPQVKAGDFSIGNLHLACRPELAVASMRVIKKLEAAHLTVGMPVAIIRSRGNVLLVKHGNPKHIESVWDLARPDVHLVTPNPYNEPGAFLNYATSIYEIAAHDPHPPAGWTADRLFNAIFNSQVPDKWLYGDRIHHRDEPWSVAYGKADVAMIMYQLGHYTADVLPAQFSIVPLGGTVADPQPVPGNFVGESWMVRIKGRFTPRQIRARNDLIAALKSPTFTRILEQNGLRRP